jgi:ElaB/YqjD/DUF883 family membrane-anchored ribosome-binding protein
MMDAVAKQNLENIGNKAQDVGDDINAIASDNLDALRKAVDGLSTQLRANASGARDFGFASLDDMSDPIKRNPLASVALAAGAGLLIGLWRRGDER